MALPGLCPDCVRFLPRCLLGKVRGVDLGSLVIHLFENYYIRVYFLFALLSLGPSQRSWSPIMIVSCALSCLGRQSLVMPII